MYRHKSLYDARSVPGERFGWRGGDKKALTDHTATHMKHAPGARCHTQVSSVTEKLAYKDKSTANTATAYAYKGRTRCQHNGGDEIRLIDELNFRRRRHKLVLQRPLRLVFGDELLDVLLSVLLVRADFCVYRLIEGTQKFFENKC